MLARRCGWLDSSEREETLHDAYVVLLQKERDGQLDPDDMHPREVRAYLVQTAIHKALDEGKRAGRKRSDPLGDAALAEPDPGRPLEELAAATLDGARVREIVSELPERRQAIVKLRFFFDRSPAEIQTYLGISERAYRKDLEHAVRHIAARYELVREGRFCDSRRSLLLAYVAGIAGPGRMAEAREHLASCPGCASWAAGVREATREAAAILPLPVPAAAAGSGAAERLGQAFESARDSVGQLLGSVSGHASTTAARIDASGAGILAGARPGAVGTLVAGCLVMGGGATYCAVQGVPEPLRPAFLTEEKKKEKAKPKRAEAKRQRARTTANPASTPAMQQSQPVAPPPTKTPRRESRRPGRLAQDPAPASQPQPAADEFGVEGSGQAPPAKSTPATSSPSSGGGSSSGGGGGGSSSGGGGASDEFGP